MSLPCPSSSPKPLTLPDSLGNSYHASCGRKRSTQSTAVARPIPLSLRLRREAAVMRLKVKGEEPTWMTSSSSYSEAEEVPALYGCFYFGLASVTTMADPSPH